VLTVPIVTQIVSTKVKSSLPGSRQDVSSLTQGQIVHGVIKSIKNQCIFVQLSGMAQLVIARLHKLESGSGAEFEGFSIGESINAKILKVSNGKSQLKGLINNLDNKKTWVELTRRKEHMSKTGNQLD